MKAMVLRAIRTPLVPEDRPDPQPGEIRVLVEACAVCRTDMTVYPLERANDALADLRGAVSGRGSARAVSTTIH